MKKSIVVFALSLAMSSATAQVLKDAEVPAQVKKAFTTQYPKITVEAWEKHADKFEAYYKEGKVKKGVSIDNSGNIHDLFSEVAVAELPKAAVTYLEKNAPGAKIKEAYSMIEASGESFYVVEANGKDHVFTHEGNFVKTK